MEWSAGLLLTAIQAHVSYTVRRSLWLAFDATWYGGGAATVGNGPSTERQSNSGVGGTVSLPIAKGQSIKIAYSSGVTGHVEARFNTIGGEWQYVWFSRH
jgi:hypothetical protein